MNFNQPPTVRNRVGLCSALGRASWNVESSPTLLRLLVIISSVATFLTPGAMDAQSNRIPPLDSIPTVRNPDDALLGHNGFTVWLFVHSEVGDTSAIRTHIELRLRQNGITIQNPPREPALNFSCLVARGVTRAELTVTCNLDVLEFTIALNPYPRRIWAKTWVGNLFVATFHASSFDAELMKQLDWMLDDFLNAWHKVNPKRR